MKVKIIGFLVASLALSMAFLPAIPQGLQECYEVCAYSCIDLAGTPHHQMCFNECGDCCVIGPCIEDPHWY